MDYLWVLAGLVLLFGGGEALVRGAVALAQRWGVSAGLVGLTLVAMGTSAPELVVSVQASLGGQPDIALGNVLGSNIANILLILGTTALIRPLAARPVVVWRDGTVMVAASLGVALLAQTGWLGRGAGGVMLVALAGFLGFTWWHDRRQGPQLAPEALEGAVLAPRPSLWGNLFWTALGLAALVGGSKALLLGATSLARAAGVSEAVIGLSLVAVGTSLPELATSLVAAWRHQADVAVGNVVGSNIFNLLGILGTAALVRPLPVDPAMARSDVWIMLGAAVLLLPFLITGWRLNRAEGLFLLVAYGGYLAYLF